jgi:uncharacterized protein (DUF302 family)
MEDMKGNMKGNRIGMTGREIVSRVISLPINAKYATIYARVSTEDQGKGFSIPTQIEVGQKLAQRERC